MEVPFDYICLLAFERMLKYEDKRKIHVKDLGLYILNTMIEFEKDFKTGTRSYFEGNLPKDFKFKRFDVGKSMVNFIKKYNDYFSYDSVTDEIILDDSVEYDMLIILLDEYEVSSRFYKVSLNNKARDLLGIETILGTLKECSLLESKLQENYEKLSTNKDDSSISMLNAIVNIRELFLDKIASMDVDKIAVYLDETDFIEFKGYDKFPVDKDFWNNSQYGNKYDPDELEDMFYELYNYALFGKNDIGPIKLSEMINELYLSKMDTEEELRDSYYELFTSEDGEKIDIDIDSLLEDCGRDPNDYRELDQLFYLNIVSKIDEYMNKHGKNKDLLKRRQRLVYALDDSKLKLYDDKNLYSLLNNLKTKFDSEDLLASTKVKSYFVLEDAFKNPNEDNMAKLLYVSSYYDISKDEKVKMLLTKYANNVNYDMYSNIILGDEKTLSI